MKNDENTEQTSIEQKPALSLETEDKKSESKQDDHTEQDEHKGSTKVIEIVTSSSIFKYFLGAMIIFGVCFISCLFTFQIVLTAVGVVGYSMQPTINASATGEYGENNIDVVYSYSASSYSYKDIVIIKEGKTTSNEKIIKRIIATPGQTITFKKIREDAKIYYEVYVNDAKLEEDYILDQNQYFNAGSTLDYPFYNQLVNILSLRGEFSLTLSSTQFFVMGDNRNNSLDSRYFGAIEKSDILGKVVLQVKYGKTLFDAIWSTIFSAKII